MSTDLNEMKTDLKNLRFFAGLSTDEQNRLRQAVADYGAVMEHNLKTLWECQTDAEREQAARPLSVNDARG